MTEQLEATALPESAESAFERGLEYLHAVRKQATDHPVGPPPATVLDVYLREHPPSRPCHLGKRQVLRRKQTVRGVYRYCHGFRCPRCVVEQVEKLLRDSFAVWQEVGTGTLWRSRFTAAQWKANPAAVRALKSDYAGRYLRVTLIDGSCLVFTPGDVLGAILVADPGPEVAAAILQAPASGVRRYTRPQRRRMSDQPVDYEHEHAPDERWRTTTLPQFTSIEEVLQDIERALGRSLDWQRLSATRGFWRAVEAEVTPAEMELVEEVVRPYADRFKLEHEFARFERGARRQHEAWEQLRRWEDVA